MSSEISEFSLSADGGPRIAGSRVKYPRDLEHYAGVYGHDVRTVKRWVSIGKAAAPMDLPPLHNPSKMPAWWQRRMQHQVPTVVLQAASSTAAAAPSRAVESVAPAAPAAPLGDRDFSDVETLDLIGNVEQLRRTVAVAKRLLDEALQGRDEGLITSRQRSYERAFDLLRKCEADVLDYKKRTETLVERSAVRAENNRIASAITTAVRRLVKAVRPQLTGKPDAEQDRIWGEETERCFAALKGARFTDAPAVA
jgi:hypothetical protein